MSKYEELKYVLSGATDWGYEYAKKEDVEAAFAELEERHAMELDQWVLELGKTKLENERLKKSLFNVQKAASDAKLSAHEKSRRIDELKAENEKLKMWMKEHFFCDEFLAAEKNEHKATRKALWTMTAYWAEAMGLASCNIANKFMSRENFEVGDDYRQKTIKKYRHRQVVFYKYADYCKRKAQSQGV